jgi:3-Oxoacyl-[acyl-carrier-protein (ACP)] synthase III
MDVSRVFICGAGVVSPAGWGMAPFRAALAAAEPVAAQDLPRPGWERPLKIRLVPPPAQRGPFLAHPRLRRSSPLSQYTAGAALEAASVLPERFKQLRMGLLLCLQSGPVQYASRFFGEALKDPSTASPMLFPETVFAAPASHIAALLENVTIAYTIVGDAGTFLQGLALAGEWLQTDRVDAALVIGGEEFNWLHSDAASHFDHKIILGTGAGALCLAREPLRDVPIELALVTDAHTYSSRCSLSQAAKAMRAQLPAGRAGDLLCDGLGGFGIIDAAEGVAWNDWQGGRMSPKRLFGEALMGAAAWQSVAAFDALAQGDARAANISIVGSNQQAIGARFTLGDL